MLSLVFLQIVQAGKQEQLKHAWGMACCAALREILCLVSYPKANMNLGITAGEALPAG